jgi:hypothetical protein
MRARARPGHRLVVIDVSCRGALVEAMRPLRPGSHLECNSKTEVRQTMIRRGCCGARWLPWTPAA